MIVLVKTMDGKINPVEVDDSDTVGGLKIKFAMNQSLNPHLIQIIFNGSDLEDSSTLTSCNITEGCQLFALKSLGNTEKKSAQDGQVTYMRSGDRFTSFEKLNRSEFNGLCKRCFEQDTKAESGGLTAPNSIGLAL